MNRSFLSVLLMLTCFSFNVIAQAKKKISPQIKAVTKAPLIKEPVNMYKITDLSFFNSAHIERIEKQIDAAISKFATDSKTNTYVGGFPRWGTPIKGISSKFLNYEFRHVGNNWFFVDNYFGPNRIFHKDAEEFSALNLEDNQTSRALNDSIFILNDGNLFNIYKNEYLTTELTTNKRLKIIDLPDRGYSPLMYGDGVVVNWSRKYVSGVQNYNILSDKMVQESLPKDPPRLENLQLINRFSNFILTSRDIYGQRNLINRYNVEEYIDLSTIHKLDFITKHNSRETEDYIPITYNDSLFISSIRLDYNTLGKSSKINKINALKLAQLISQPNGANLPFSLDEFSIIKDANTSNQWNSNDAKVQQKLSKIFEKDFDSNYLKTVYFQSSFNKLTEDQVFESQDIEQKVKIADKFIPYIPEIIFIYNFRTNSVQLLKRSGLPFGRLKNLLIDRSNNLLIAQSDDSKFTIFDIRNGKEIITIKGIINHISDENKLILNLYCLENDDVNVDNMISKNKISGYSLDLNELLNIKNIYFKDFVESINVDEFTNEDDFQSKLKELENNNRLAFSGQEKIKNNQIVVFSKPYQVDNKKIQDVLESQLKKFFQGQGSIPSDIKLPLKYSLWDPSSQTLKLTAAIDSSDWKYFKDQPYWSWVHDSGEEAVLVGPYRKFNLFEGRINGRSINFEISPVDVEDAKKVKNGSSKLEFILRNEGIYIPKYQHIVYSRFLDRFKIVNNWEAELANRKKILNEFYLLQRNSLHFFDSFFMKENEDEIPLRSNNSSSKKIDGYSNELNY